jgi:DNA-directed RNA polymerase sigma subunit (sigma70/sigma32)
MTMVFTMTDIQLFQILKQKLGEKEAEALVDFVDLKLKQSQDANSKVTATKEDIAKLETKLSESKSEVIKWMVGLFIPLYLTIIGLIVTLLLKH